MITLMNDDVCRTPHV